jgi:peptidyl-Asp metalloendopeptidase
MAIDMQPSRRLSALAIVAFLGVSAYNAPISTQILEPQWLFEDVPLEAELDAAGLPGPALRHRAVRIAWPRLLRDATGADARVSSPPDRLELNLFPDVELIAERGRGAAAAAAGPTSWIGVVADTPVSYVSLTWVGTAMSGMVRIDSRVFEILPRGDSGVHVILERQPGPDMDEGPPIPVPEMAVDSEPPSAPLDSGNVLDVMFLYTTAMKNAYGGEPGIRARFAQAAADANAIFANSEIPGLRVRIVAVKEINYVQAPNNMTADLTHIRTVSGVQTWRTTTGADLVQLMVGASDHCGLGYQMGPGASAGFASHAFSVVADHCVAQFTPAHEMGHNLGSHHAASDPIVGQPSFSYSYGYKEPARLFRTVMAYECSGGTCPRIPMFSDDDLRHNGRPAGAPLAQNAVSVGETRYTAANWRTARYPEGAPGQSGTPQVATVGPQTTVSWSAPTTGGAAAGYRLYVGRSAGATDVGSFLLPFPDRTLSGVLPGGTYYVRVAPLNSQGQEGPPSEETTFTVQGPMAPGAPTGLAASVSGRNVTLTWRAPTTGGAVTGYLVQGGPAPGSTAATATSASTVFVTPPLADGFYSVRVRAYNDVGTGGPSNEVSFRIGASAPPGPPRNLQGTTRGSTVTLGWQAPSSGGPVAEYFVEVGSASGGSNLGVFPNGTALGLSASAPAGRFFVRVRARNSAGASSPSNEVVLNSGVNTCVGDLSARLDWNTPTDIDLHLNEPSGAHVYFFNKVGPTARLDFDNTAGYGPENICVGAGRAASGTYRIYVVPYRGSFWPTRATIDVRVFANSSREVARTFTRLLSGANSRLGYNVANVTFPAGTITEVTGTRGVSDEIPTLDSVLFRKPAP